MANNYTSFSTMVPLPGISLEKLTIWLEKRRKAIEETKQGYLGHQAEACNEALWIKDDDGDVQAAAETIQAALKTFNIVGTILLEYANTCSKLRPGEFGGGVLVVAREGIWWNDSYSFLEQVRKENNLPPLLC